MQDYGVVTYIPIAQSEFAGRTTYRVRIAFVHESGLGQPLATDRVVRELASVEFHVTVPSYVVIPVSYTHLDVYKRQVLLHLVKRYRT